MSNIGTVATGIKTPIIREGDDIVKIVSDCVNSALTINDGDIIGITESIVARALGKYVTLDEISSDIINKFGPSATIGLINPIMSRNRFGSILKGICRAASEVIILFSYPNDEKGNPICDIDRYNELEVENITFSRKDFEELFGKYNHPFTGINYFDLYEEIANSENCKIRFLVSNNPKIMLNFTKNIMVCDIHTRERTKAKFKDEDAKIFDLSDICHDKCEYGLYGSNKTDEERLKLFPDSSNKQVVLDIQNEILKLTGKNVEVMIYGDGCFHDPVAGIWEFADPVTSPCFTDGLKGTPNELKIKYLADKEFKGLNGKELDDAIKEKISNKKQEIGAMGTTPRHYTDLLASLMDLISGSGDKGTPVVVIQRYFNNYSME